MSRHALCPVGRLGSIRAKLLLVMAVAIVPALILAPGNAIARHQASVAHAHQEALDLAPSET